MTRTTSSRVLSVSRSRATASMRRTRPSSESAAGGPSSGTSRASSRTPGPAAWLTRSAPRSATRRRTASTSGTYGVGCSPPSTQHPHSTRTGAGSLPRASEITRVLPTPASPPTRTVCASPSQARAATSSNVDTSRSRPTNGDRLRAAPMWTVSTSATSPSAAIGPVLVARLEDVPCDLMAGPA